MVSAPEKPLERIGHRGIPAERLENTLAGFVLAVEHGANAVELDTHVSADGVVVVHHDETVRGKAIATHAWSDLEALDLGGGARVPTLDQVLAGLAGKATVYVEMKGASIEEHVVGVVRRHSTAVALHSFDHAAVQRARAIAPDIPRGILLDRGITNPIQTMRRAIERTGARDVWPHWSLASADLVRAASDLGSRVIVWTVNSRDSARHLQALGVDGVCTDDVRILANL